jgi:hypothetical protein
MAPGLVSTPRRPRRGLHAQPPAARRDAYQDVHLAVSPSTLALPQGQPIVHDADPEPREARQPASTIGWKCILTHGRQGTESDAERIAIWIAERGTRLGLRPPNVQDRSAARGLTELDAHLGLTEEERFNAQGNAMDPAAVQCRIAPLISACAEQPARVVRHPFRPSHALQHVYEQLRSTILDASGPEGEGALEEQDLYTPPLPHVDPITGRAKALDCSHLLSGPGGRGCC